MTIIFIEEGHGFKNNACYRTYDGYFVAEFVFLMLFTLADTLHFWLMNGIFLFPTIPPLGKNGFKESKQFVIVVIFSKITLQFPNQSSGYCT